MQGDERMGVDRHRQRPHEQIDSPALVAPEPS
jgi:hypothetical protein